MGKRKSRMSKLAAQPRKPPKLETAFTCPFCNHAGAVECRIDLKYAIAVASCFVCKEDYSTTAHALTEPIDVYGEWVDECVKANEDVDVRIKRRRGYGDDEDA
ncbi:hypothetical protein ACP70R_041798 [Stipagrostis hirtigluma subsp. patula]